jgi:3-oxoacyl-[acyl-carrier protein] reductase
MQLDLTDKVALVTGSSKGIGWAIAKTLHAEGCRVALNGRNEADLATATTQLDGSIGLLGDVTDPADAKHIVAEVLSTFGQLDILVCNVGSGRSLHPATKLLTNGSVFLP